MYHLENMRNSANRKAFPPPAPLPSVQEECESDTDAAVTAVAAAVAEEDPGESLTRQLGLPPVARKPLHWRVVRPRDESTAGSPPSVSPSAGSSKDNGRCDVGGEDGRARHHGDGVLSSFSVAAQGPAFSGVPRQIGLTARKHRSPGSTNGGSTIDTGGTGTTISSLRTAPSLGSIKSEESASSASSFLEAVTKRAVHVSFSGSAGKNKASTLPAHRRRKGGAFERALSERHRNRTLMVLSAAAIVGASMSVLTLPSRRTGPVFDSASRTARGLRERLLHPPPATPAAGSGRALIALESRHLDRYPFTNLAENDELVDAKTDVALYWQIPRSGGTTFKHVLGSCLDLVQASRTTKDYCDMEKDELELCETKFGRFVNADPSDDPGIKRGRELGLVQSGLVDVVVSSRFLHSAGLFDPDGGTGKGGKGGGKDTKKSGGKGRAFTVLRHPVERSLSTFRYLQNAHWERNYNPEFKNLSVVQWTQRIDTANNWMVRWLTGKNHEAELEPGDLDFAKEVLRRKFLILLTDDLVIGVDRLIRYIGWDTTAEQRKCARGAAMKAAAQNKASSALEEGGVAEEGQLKDAQLVPGNEEYEALARINDLDIKLYEFARELYDEQWKTIFMEGKALKIRGDDNGADENAVAAAASLAAAFESGKSNNSQDQNEAKKRMNEEMMSTNKALAEAAAEAKAKAKGEKRDDYRGDAGRADSLPPPSPKEDKESLPLPPEMARLAAQFGPIKDTELDQDAEAKKTSDMDDKDGTEPRKSSGGQNPPPQDKKERQQAAAAAAAVEKDELPVPPEMARLAAAFGGGGNNEEIVRAQDGPTQKEVKQDTKVQGEEEPKQESMADEAGDRGDLMSSDDGAADGGANEEGAGGGTKETLPVPPEMARLAAAFENRNSQH